MRQPQASDSVDAGSGPQRPCAETIQAHDDERSRPTGVLRHKDPASSWVPWTASQNWRRQEPDCRPDARQQLLLPANARVWRFVRGRRSRLPETAAAMRDATQRVTLRGARTDGAVHQLRRTPRRDPLSDLRCVVAWARLSRGRDGSSPHDSRRCNSSGFATGAARRARSCGPDIRA